MTARKLTEKEREAIELVRMRGFEASHSVSGVLWNRLVWDKLIDVSHACPDCGSTKQHGWEAKVTKAGNEALG
jgi:hypothetical protein